MPWDQVMHKWGEGKLKSGGSGKPVTSQKQAVAIMESEKRASSHKPEYRSAHSSAHAHASPLHGIGNS